MNDLLQLGPHTLSTLTQSNPKPPMSSTTQIVTKRTSNCTPILKKAPASEVRIVHLQPTKTAAILSSKKHKIATALDANGTKRIKGLNGGVMTSIKIDSQRQQQMNAAPQLLQQLMAPMPQRARPDEVGENDGTGSKWTNDPIGGQNSQNLDIKMPLQPSNSVLKNLLVSGCDVNAGYICTVPMPIHQKKAARA